MANLTITVNDGIQRIKINRPAKRNAINAQMYLDITNALNSAAKDDSILITILTGEGSYYSSGNDLIDAMKRVDSPSSADESVLRVKNFIDAFISYPKLLVAVVNGPAIGIATTTLGLCDLVYASDKATFSTPFTKLGISIEGCSAYTFPRILGSRKATEMLLLGKVLSAEEAFTYGFVNEVFPHEKLEERVMSSLSVYKELSHKSVVNCKNLIKRFEMDQLYLANIVEAKGLLDLWSSEDSMEAMVRFMNRKSKL